MAKKAYIGRTDTVPIYQSSTVSITNSNIGTYFTVQNGSYYFAGSGSTFTSNNKGVNNSTATTTLIAKQDCDVSFNYSYSSEASYDKFSLTVNGTPVESNVSGATTNKTYSGSLKTGQSIIFTYSKDSSQHENDDQCTFSNLKITIRTFVRNEQQNLSHLIKKIYIGIGNVSRKVKKAYIGVDGVAKLFYQMMKFTLTEVTTDLEFEYVSYPYEEDLQACTAFNKAGLFGLHPEENSSPYYSYSYINLFDDKMTKSLIEIHPASTSVQITPMCASDGNKMYFIMYYNGPYNVYQLTSSHTYSVLYPDCTAGSMMHTRGHRNRDMHDFFDGFFHLGSDVTDVFHMSSTGTVTTLNRENYTPDTDEAETPGSALLGDNMILACWDALMGNRSSFVGAVSRSLTYQNLPNLNNPRALESGCASNGDAVVISGYVRYEEDLQEQYFDKALVLHTLPAAQWVPYSSTPLEFQGNACFIGGDSGYGQSRNAIISYDTSLTLHRVTSSKTIARYPAAAYAGDYLYSTKAVDWETDGYRQMNVFKLS